jgi:hypothetical protein
VSQKAFIAPSQSISVLGLDFHQTDGIRVTVARPIDFTVEDFHRSADAPSTIVSLRRYSTHIDGQSSRDPCLSSEASLQMSMPQLRDAHLGFKFVPGSDDETTPGSDQSRHSVFNPSISVGGPTESISSQHYLAQARQELLRSVRRSAKSTRSSARSGVPVVPSQELNRGKVESTSSQSLLKGARGTLPLSVGGPTQKRPRRRVWKGPRGQNTPKPS